MACQVLTGFQKQGRSCHPCSSYPPSVVNRGPVVLLPSPTSGRSENQGRACRPLFVYPSSVVDCGPFDGLPSPDRFSKAGTVLSSLLILSTLCREPRSRCAITKSYLRTVPKKAAWRRRS